MDEAKRKALEEAGFTVGSVEEFLGLSEEEEARVAERLASRLRAERIHIAANNALIVGLVCGLVAAAFGLWAGWIVLVVVSGVSLTLVALACFCID